MSFKKINGLVRLVAAITVSVLLLPYIIRLYLFVLPGTPAKELWTAFIQAAPFGEHLATAIIAVWGETQSGIDSILELITSHKFSFEVFLSVELAELIATSVLMILLTNVVGKKLLNNHSGGLYNDLANLIFQVFLVFTASLVTDWIFKFFTSQVINLPNIIHDIVSLIYSGILGIGGTALLVFSGIMVWDAILLVGIGCMKTLISYVFFLQLLLHEINGDHIVIIVWKIVAWFVLLWLLQRIESLLLPQNT